MSHAADVMSAHVEHLKRRRMTDSEELLEVRKLLHRRKGRLHSDSTGQCRPLQIITAHYINLKCLSLLKQMTEMLSSDYLNR